MEFLIDIEDDIKGLEEIHTDAEKQEGSEIETEAVKDEVEQTITDEQSGEETPFTILAKQYKEKGYLIDEIEIEKDFDYNKLEEAVYKSIEKKSEDQIRQKVYEELKEDGITEEVIESIKLQKSGVTNDEVQRLNLYSNLALLDLSQVPEEVRDAELLAWTKIKYKEKGYEDKHAEIAATEEIDSDPAAAAKSNKEFFLNKYSELEGVIKGKKEAEENNRKQKVDEEITKVKSIIESGKIAGEEFSKSEVEKLKKAFFDKTETVKIGDKYYKVTLLQKKIIEEKANPENLILKNAQLVLGITPKKALEKGKEKGADEAAKAFLKAQQKAGTSATRQNSVPSEGGFMFEID